MTSVRVELDTAKLEQLLARAPAEAERAVGKALHDEALVAFDVSQSIVPFRWGALQGSGQVTEPKVTSSGVEVELSYGNTSVDYALKVHETPLNYRGGRQHKYLEGPVLAQAPRVGPAVRDALDQALRRLA